MIKEPLVSIVIPNFNNGKMLARAVFSCMQQDYKNIQIVIVDDASTDNSLSFIEDIDRVNPNVIKVLLADNVGPLKARLAGVKQSSGELIVFLDPDDELVEFSLKKLLVLHEANKTDITVSGYEGHRLGGINVNKPRELFLDNDREIRSFFWSTSFRYLWGKVYSRNMIISVMDELITLPYRHNEDVVANYLMLYRNSGLKIQFTPICSVRYYQSSNSITQTKSFANFKDAFCAIEWINNDLNRQALTSPVFTNYFFSKLFDLAKADGSLQKENKYYIKEQSKLYFSKNQELHLKSRVKKIAIDKFIFVVRGLAVFKRRISRLR